MLNGGISRGQARTRPSTAHAHSSHMMSSFNPLSTSCLSRPNPNPNPNPNGFAGSFLDSGIAVLSSDTGCGNPISLSANSTRSIDLRKTASIDHMELDLEGGEYMALKAILPESEANSPLPQLKEKSAEILPMLLKTPKLSILSDVEQGGHEELSASRPVPIRVKSTEKECEYIPASCSPGIGVDMTLPDVAEQSLETGRRYNIPIMDESKSSREGMQEDTVRGGRKYSRELPDPLLGENSARIDVPPLDRLDLNEQENNPLQPQAPVQSKQKNARSKKNRNGIVLRPLNKSSRGSNGRMAMDSSSSEEEEERKESGETDSECEGINSTALVLSPCANSSGGIVSGSAGFRGLKNLGNTCYMNSTLQCLSNIPGFREFFLRKKHLEELNTTRGQSKGELAKAFGALLVRLWQSKSEGSLNSVKPVQVKKIIGKVASRFSGYQQHDAQEFLLFLLDALHDDLNRVVRQVPFEELKDIPAETNDAKAQRCWQNYIDRNDSFIVDTFCGQLHSEIVCQQCGKTSNVFEPFMDLSTPIPEATDNRPVSVQDCLNAFTQTEVLSGLEAVYCSKCKDHCESMKTIRVHKLPEVLVIHLKRFSSHKKLAKAVQIPIESLDMQPYTTSAASPLRDNEQQEYKLIGAVNHMGSFHGGHYTADCLHSERKQWCKFNDSIVSNIKPEQIDNEDAYLLIYLRVDASRAKAAEWSHL